MNQAERNEGLIDAEDIVNAYLNDSESNIGKHFAYITDGRRLYLLLRDTSKEIADFLNKNKEYQPIKSEISQITLETEGERIYRERSIEFKKALQTPVG